MRGRVIERAAVVVSTKSDSLHLRDAPIQLAAFDDVASLVEDAAFNRNMFQSLLLRKLLIERTSTELSNFVGIRIILVDVAVAVALPWAVSGAPAPDTAEVEDKCSLDRVDLCMQSLVVYSINDSLPLDGREIEEACE